MKWYYLDETGEVVGPVSEPSLLELEASGVLGPGSKVCREGTEDWVPVAVALTDGGLDQASESGGFKFPCPHCDHNLIIRNILYWNAFWPPTVCPKSKGDLP